MHLFVRILWMGVFFTRTGTPTQEIKHESKVETSHPKQAAIGKRCVNCRPGCLPALPLNPAGLLGFSVPSAWSFSCWTLTSYLLLGPLRSMSPRAGHLPAGHLHPVGLVGFSVPLGWLLSRLAPYILLGLLRSVSLWAGYLPAWPLHPAGLCGFSVTSGWSSSRWPMAVNTRQQQASSRIHCYRVGSVTGRTNPAGRLLRYILDALRVCTAHIKQL